MVRSPTAGRPITKWTCVGLDHANLRSRQIYCGDGASTAILIGDWDTLDRRDKDERAPDRVDTRKWQPGGKFFQARSGWDGLSKKLDVPVLPSADGSSEPSPAAWL